MYKPSHVLYLSKTRTPLLSYFEEEYGVCYQSDNKGDGICYRLVWGRSGKNFNKFEEMHLTPGKASIVQAPIIEESPLCIECRIKEIISLGSHDMFIADVVNVKADEKYLDSDTGKFDLAKSNLLVYAHGGYYEMGEKSVNSVGL